MRFNRHIGLLFLCFVATSAFANDQLMQKMLSHVEKILVVDTIDVDKDRFFQYYRTHPSAGFILEGKSVASRLGSTKFPEEFSGKPMSGFTNEYEDYMIWAQEDTTGYLRLAESVRLIDGSWSKPEFTSPRLNFGEDADDDTPVEANAAFPFMVDDGQTLYFASDNENSIGGYDIFIATKDPSDGSFLIPGNLGMPFNSPYDDYMMVLDRQTGVGWWASDRNQLEDKVTVYIFEITEERDNIDPDDEKLMSYATLSGWQDLIDEESIPKIEKLKKEISEIKKVNRKEPEFSLPMPGGNVYSYFSDFRNRSAAELMKRYLRDKESLKVKNLELAKMRADYDKNNDRGQLSTKILNMEQQVRMQEQQLKALLSQIYNLELN